MLQGIFTRYASCEAIVDGDTRLSYSDLQVHVLETASALQALNFRQGDKLVLWAGNSWRWIVVALACLWQGGVVVPLSPRLRPSAVEQVVHSVKARIIFTDDFSTNSNLLNTSSGGAETNHSGLEADTHLKTTIVSLDDSLSSPGEGQLCWSAFINSAVANCSIPAAPEPEDPWAIFFTSGTTNRPKAAVYSHHQSVRARWEVSIERKCTAAEKLLVTAPYSHILGLSGNLLLGLVAGMTHIVVSNEREKPLEGLIQSEGVQLLTGPPSLFRRLLTSQKSYPGLLQALRSVWIGAAEISPQLVKDLHAAGVREVVTAYGLTECELGTVCHGDAPLEIIATTVGKPNPGMSVKLVDDLGREVNDGEPGQILLRGYAVMSGYFNDPALTNESISPDGWLNTGDLGRITAEGNLQVVGRLKEIIIVHGFNVYPAEVEELLLSSGLLKEVVVVGKASRLSGEECAAFAVAKNTATDCRAKLMKWSRHNLPSIQVPSRIIMVDSLPLNETGKVDKLLLRSLLRH